MKKILGVAICLALFTAINIEKAVALEGKIKDIIVEKKENSADIIFKTEGDIKIIAYDISKPSQIIIDIIGNGFAKTDENIPVNFGAIEQIKVIKSDFMRGNYYGVDFWVIELTTPVEYQFSFSEGSYILRIAKSKDVGLEDKRSGKELSLPRKTAETVSVLAEDSAESLRKKGIQYQLAGEYQKAADYYQEAIDNNPEYITAYNDLGIVYHKYLGKTQKAIELFEKALKINPDYPGAHTNLALIYEEMNDEKNALLHWSQRARLGNPQDYWTEIAKRKLKESAN
ncbi:MAG: tetratricopeptide repeat protein [Candidatus Omnitrophota bacterium]